MEFYRELMELTGRILDAVGVFVIIIGAATASVWFAARAKIGSTNRYRTYRQDLGRAILLGLEFLIAGDIIELSPILGDGLMDQAAAVWA